MRLPVDTILKFQVFVVPYSNKPPSNPTWQKPTYCLEVKGKKLINQSLRDFRYHRRLWFVVICKNQSPIMTVKISKTSEANYYTAFPFIWTVSQTITDQRLQNTNLFWRLFPSNLMFGLLNIQHWPGFLKSFGCLEIPWKGRH